MNSEQDWAERVDAGDDTGAAERYQFFMRPEPHSDLGPIYTVNDTYLGDKAQVRQMKVGMVRNAKEEDKKEVTVYLKPFPHIRITRAKELQGWYQSLYNVSKASRPRPCFTEAILTEPYGGYCAVGCAFSLPAGELINTPTGFKRIESFKVGNLVMGRTNEGVRITKVLGTSAHWKPEGLVILTLSDGRQLRLTGDHPIHSMSRGWVAAETLGFGEELEDVNMLQVSRSSSERPKVVQTLLAGVQQEETYTAEGLSGLSQPDKEQLHSLPGLCTEDQGIQREYGQGKVSTNEGQAQISRDKTEDECSCDSPQRKYGSSRSWSEVSGVQAGQSRGCSNGEIRVQTLQASRVQRQERQDISDEVCLGSVGSSTPRQEGVRLGLRTLLNTATRWISILARLLTVQWLHHRGERLHDGGRRREDQTGQSIGVQNPTVRSEAAEKARNPYVIGIERVPGAVKVFDIETETGNFYQNGILVHNCYINSGMRGYRGTGLISVPMNYGDQIREQLGKMRRGAAGYFSSFTDPFTPLEEFYHNTELAAQEFVRAGLPLFFLSRLPYPDWAVELLRQNPHSYAQKSINTSSPDDWRHLSPGALDWVGHMDEIRMLKENNIYVSIQCNPIVPGVTTHADIYKLFRALKFFGADHVIVKFVEAGYSWAPEMIKKMIKRFGYRGREFERLFTDNMGSQRVVQEAYRLEAHEMYSKWAKQFGLSYATCYEYKYERDTAGKILSKTGISIGREYTTADQCHGHSVPVYTRDSEAEQFRPVDECPPSGCLYCASENSGEPRCGDELAGQANNVVMKDLKVPIGQGKKRTLELPLV